MITPPRGRLLYRPSDDARYIVVRHDRTGALWLIEDGWTAQSRAAGPFHPNDVLRALRLASTLVPDGCELGPWQPGICLFPPATLPRPHEWSRFDSTWLPPSVSRYSAADVSGAVHETCCSPPLDEPRVAWGAAPPGAAPEELLALARERHPDLAPTRTGTLHRAWNAHPAGSPVLARTETLEGPFLVVDLAT